MPMSLRRRNSASASRMTGTITTATMSVPPNTIGLIVTCRSNGAGTVAPVTVK